MKTSLFLILFMLMAHLASTQPFDVQVSLPKTDFILGEPIMATGTAKNTTGRNVKIALGENGFSTYFRVVRADGAPRKGCLREIVDYTEVRVVDILPNWIETKTEDVSCNDATGSFKIEFIASSSPGLTANQPTWSGLVESAPLFYTIIEPQGIDKEAFEEFNGIPLAESKRGLLLHKFPTSVYAAYAVFQSLDSYLVDPEIALAQMEGGHYLNSSRPDETGQSFTGWRSLGPEQTLAWHKKWFEIIRTNHPNIWFEPYLALREALDELAIKQYDRAAANLRALARKPAGKPAQIAERYLSLLKGKNLISN